MPPLELDIAEPQIIARQETDKQPTRFVFIGRLVMRVEPTRDDLAAMPIRIVSDQDQRLFPCNVIFSTNQATQKYVVV